MQLNSANELFGNLQELMTHTSSMKNDSPELYHNIRYNYYKLLDMGMKNGLLNDFAESYVNQSFMNNYQQNNDQPEGRRGGR